MKLALCEESTPRRVDASGPSDRGSIRSRPLLLMERTMYRDGRTPFTSVFAIKLRGFLDESQLRRALRRVQSKHPLLRCVVQDSCGRPHFVLQHDPASIPLRIVERTGEDQWEEEVRREWIAPFDGASEPLLRLVWLRGSGVHNWILAGHHCICDGQAGIGLLQDLLQAYENTECDFASYQELGSLDELLPRALLQDRKLQCQVRWKRRSLECVLWWKTRHYRKPEPIHPESMYFHRCVLRTAISQAIAERAKAAHVTFLAPIALAFMQAFHDVRGTGAFGKVSAMVNARRFLPRVAQGALFGLAPGVRIWVGDLRAPPDIDIDNFWKRACAIKVSLDEALEDLGSTFHQYLLSLEGLHHKYERIVNFFEQAPPIRHLTFSNMGRLALETQYGNVRVEKVYSPVVMVSPTPANTVVLSNFAGETEFAVISDEQSLPRADAAIISRRVAEILQASTEI